MNEKRKIECLPPPRMPFEVSIKLSSFSISEISEILTKIQVEIKKVRDDEIKEQDFIQWSMLTDSGRFFCRIDRTSTKDRPHYNVKRNKWLGISDNPTGENPVKPPENS